MNNKPQPAIALIYLVVIAIALVVFAFRGGEQEKLPPQQPEVATPIEPETATEELPTFLPHISPTGEANIMTIEELAEAINMTPSGKAIWGKSNPNFVNGQACPGFPNSTGCYIRWSNGSKEIRISRGSNNPVKVAKHELGHGVYYSLSDTTRIDNLVAEHIAANKAHYQSKLDVYAKFTPEKLKSEKHSIAFASSLDKSDELARHISKYLILENTQ